MTNIDLWGITEKGFYCPTEEEILAEKIKLTKELFGEDISTSDKTPLGKLLRISAASEHKVYEVAEEVYYSFSPATARGVSLDRALSFIRAARNTATCAKHIIRVYGTKGYTIKAGMLFRTKSGVVFYALSDYVIDTAAGDRFYTDCKVQCTVAGTAGNVSNINATVTVNNDIAEIEYLEQVASGEDTESDAAARERYNTIVAGLGENTAAAIIANVMRINGVHACIVKDNNTENDKIISDTLTIKKGSYGVIVHAQSNLRDEIGEAIFNKQPFGILQSGLEQVTVKDAAGEEHTVKFTYVTEKKVNLDIKCTVTGEFSNDGKAQIADNLKEYIDGLAIGKTLIYSKLYEYIHKVTGVDDVLELKVNGTAGNISVSDIEIIKSGIITISTTEV